MDPHLLSVPNTLSLVPTTIWYISTITSGESHADTYTAELAKKTDGHGDCCMLTPLEWGHARNELTEDANDIETEGHMNHVGGFSSQVNETCLSCDHKAFMVAPSDKDAHNPILIHVTPSEMTWNEQRTYIPAARKIARKQRRKEIQKTNKRKSFQAEEEDDDDDDEPWVNFTAQEWRDYQAYHRRRQRESGYGRSSVSSSQQWRPKDR